MEELINSACLFFGVDPGSITLKQQRSPVRDARMMLWAVLVRDAGFSYAQIASRFGCSRRNVIWTVRNFEGSLEVHPFLRSAFAQFRSSLRPLVDLDV